MVFVVSTGSAVAPVDVTGLIDGLLTIRVMLTTGAGNTYATTLMVTKDTVPAVLQVPASYYINSANVGASQPLFTGELSTTVIYSITAGTTTLTGDKFVNGSNKWQPGMVRTTLKNGPVTRTVTETDPAGH